MKNVRQSRKKEHIDHFLKTFKGRSKNGFSDITLIHDCLSENFLGEISLSTEIGGIKLDVPIIINAITGGDEKVAEINKKMAIVAKNTGLAMAVGSQFAAIKNPAVVHSYEIVRKYNPDGILFANIGAHATPKEALQAVDMIAAQALQIHLNIAQELFMQEGDSDFRGYLDNIIKIAEHVNVPVIVKETGCGMALEQVSRMLDNGIKIIDVSGKGGTNFISIESSRCEYDISEDIADWGITTAASAIEAVQAAQGKADIIVSGGINTSLDIVKALAIGGNAVAIAGVFLKELLANGNDEQILCDKITVMLEECKKIMLLCGARSIKELYEKPVVIKGSLKEWLEARGFDVMKISHSRYD